MTTLNFKGCADPLTPWIHYLLIRKLKQLQPSPNRFFNENQCLHDKQPAQIRYEPNPIALIRNPTHPLQLIKR